MSVRMTVYLLDGQLHALADRLSVDRSLPSQRQYGAEFDRLVLLAGDNCREQNEQENAFLLHGRFTGFPLIEPTTFLTHDLHTVKPSQPYLERLPQIDLIPLVEAPQM